MKCPVYEIFFGGARGGGKTDAVLGRLAIRATRYGKHFNALHVRREMPQSDDVIERSKQIFAPMGAKWRDHPHRQWTFPSGGILRFRPLETVESAQKYQGQNLTDIVVEEAGSYPDPAPIQRLHACLRSAHGVPTSLVLTGNPGGPGHQWLRARYVDPAPEGMKVLEEVFKFRHITSRRERIFIPSKVTDNKLMDLEQYVGSLSLSGSESLVRAWLEGDWDAILGQYFDCWSPDRHVCRPWGIPDHWLRFRSFDWGSARPFAVHWWAVASEDTTVEGRIYPKGCMICYREWYGMVKGQPNTGLKLSAEAVAHGILDKETRKERAAIAYSVADPSIFHTDGGPSIRERMAIAGVVFRPADNRRTGANGHMGGWDQMRARLVGPLEGEGPPMLVLFNTCMDAIRTIPALQHDEKHPEDLDTTAEDHAADSVRYACMSRPWLRHRPADEVMPRGVYEMTLEEAFKENAKGHSVGRPY